MTSFSATRLPSRQTAAKVILADVTIVMAGSSPAEPPQSTVSAVSHSTFSRLDMPDAAKPPEFTPAQVPGQIKPSLPGVTPSDIASDNAVPTSVDLRRNRRFRRFLARWPVSSSRRWPSWGTDWRLWTTPSTDAGWTSAVPATAAPASVARPAAAGFGLKARSRAFNCPLARWQ